MNLNFKKRKKKGPMGVVKVITWLLREEHQLPWVIYVCISPSGVQNLSAIEFIFDWIKFKFNYKKKEMQIDTKKYCKFSYDYGFEKKLLKEIESKKHFLFLFTCKWGKHILAWNHCSKIWLIKPKVTVPKLGPMNHCH